MTRHDTVPPVLFRPAMTDYDQFTVCATADASDTAMARLRDPFQVTPESLAGGGEAARAA